MQLIRDGEPRKATSTFTQLLSSKARRTPLRLIYRALWLDPVRKKKKKKKKIAGPGEIKTREIEVDPQESPGEIKSREAELGSQRKLDSPLLQLFLNNCFSDILTSIVVVFKFCFTSTGTVVLLGTGAQDVHLDFHTAPEI